MRGENNGWKRPSAVLTASFLIFEVSPPCVEFRSHEIPGRHCYAVHPHPLNHFPDLEPSQGGTTMVAAGTPTAITSTRLRDFSFPRRK